MPWRGPEHPDDFPSLGWDLLEWFTQVLPSPRDPSKPLLFTDEQAWHIVEWYRLDKAGRRVHRRGYSRRSKGYGKSPLEAAKGIGEFAGPVRFGGWDSHGEPVGIPWGCQDAPRAWVQVGAISEDQTDNTWSVIHYFLTENDGRAADLLGIDAGLTRCFLRGQPGAKMEPVTSAAGSREGQPITYGIIDESHLMTSSNGGVKLARTIRRNVAKMNGTSFETTNAYIIGQGSVAELSHKAVLAGTTGIFADDVEAPREIRGIPVDLSAADDVLLEALGVAYGKSWWVDKPRLIADIRDASTPWEDSARFFFNWPQSDEATSAKLPSVAWMSTISTEYVDVVPGGITIAFDVDRDGAWSSVAIASGSLSAPYVEVVKHDPLVGWLPGYLVELVKKWNPIAVGCNGAGPTGAQVPSVLQAFAAAGIDVDLFRSLNVPEYKAACGGFYTDVVEGRLTRPSGQGPLDLAAADATERPLGGAWVWDLRTVTVPISPLVACTIARALLPTAGQMHSKYNDDRGLLVIG